jgi:hypothetical protein
MNIKTQLSLERKLSTGNYENVTIRLDMETDVSADGIDELNTKFEFFRSQFMEKFRDTQSKVSQELGIEEKTAFISSPVVAKKIQKLNEMELKEVLGD